MSDTTHAPAAAEEYVPTHVLSSEEDATGQPQPGPQQPGGQPGEQPKPEGEQPKEGDPPKEGEADPKNDFTEQLKKLETATKARIDSLTRHRRDAEARAEAAERRMAELEARVRTGQSANPDADMERLINERATQRAQQMRAQEQEQARVSSFHEAGGKAYPDWQQRCADLIEMGADADFARILVEMGQDGARVAGDLVDNPAEVVRITALPTERARALALGQYAATMAAKRAAPPAAPPRSNMPPPIRPPSQARAKPEPNPEGTMAEYEEWSRTHLKPR